MATYHAHTEHNVSFISGKAVLIIKAYANPLLHGMIIKSYLNK